MGVMIIINEAKDLINKYKNKSPQEKVKALPHVSRIRGEIFKQYRGKKMDPQIKKVLSDLGRTFPPSLYRLRKRKTTKVSNTKTKKRKCKKRSKN